LLFVAETSLNALNFGRGPRYLLIMFKSLRRNMLRTSLTYLGVFVFVQVIVMVWSILSFLSQVTKAQSKDLKAIVTEKHQLPSQMPFAYADRLGQEALSLPEHLRPSEADLMTWQFYGGTLDPAKRTREHLLFFFAMEPSKLRTMMDELEDLDPALVKKLEANPRGCLLGTERMKMVAKQVGESFKITSLNYKGVDLEFEVVGELTHSRYSQMGVMNRDYLNRALEDYERREKKKHPLADKSLNLYWMRLPSSEAFEVVAARMSEPGKFARPAVKVETASSGVASFLDAYRDLIWAMRYLVSPAMLASMALIIATAISISVRERLTEMAVLKVLGFQPRQIISLVLGEGLLIGAISGFLSAAVAVVAINAQGGVKFGIAFFPAFLIPPAALWWGPAVGGAAALLGSFLPAWSARTVKVSEVFSRVA
jgi:putative ABC transport system permease protein